MSVQYHVRTSIGAMCAIPNAMSKIVDKKLSQVVDKSFGNSSDLESFADLYSARMVFYRYVERGTPLNRGIE